MKVQHPQPGNPRQRFEFELAVPVLLHISSWPVYILAILNSHIDSSKRKWINQARSDCKLDLRPSATTTCADWELLDPLLCLPLGATESQVLQSFSIYIRPCYFSSSFYENWSHAMLIFCANEKTANNSILVFCYCCSNHTKMNLNLSVSVNSVSLDVVTANQRWKQQVGVSCNQRNRTYCVTLSHVGHAGTISLVHLVIGVDTDCRDQKVKLDSISGARQVCSIAAPCRVSLKALKSLRFHCLQLLNLVRLQL